MLSFSSAVSTEKLIQKQLKQQHEHSNNNTQFSLAEDAKANGDNGEHSNQHPPASSATAETATTAPSLFQRCFRARFQGYWDTSTRSMRSFDPVCDQNLRTLLLEDQEPVINDGNRSGDGHENKIPDKNTTASEKDQITAAATSNNNEPPLLNELLDGACILLLGDSTDRQLIEHWCPRWMCAVPKRRRRRRKGNRKKGTYDSGGITIWMPDNIANATTSGRHEEEAVIMDEVWDNAGLQCTPGGTGVHANSSSGRFTIGSYMHYGVAPPPYWKYAHMYSGKNFSNTSASDLGARLNWGSTTEDRVLIDVPKFFARCREEHEQRDTSSNSTSRQPPQGRHRHRHRRPLNVVVVQSYYWDLARQWYVHKTDRPPPSFYGEWANNATRLVEMVRTALTNATSTTRVASSSSSASSPPAAASASGGAAASPPTNDEPRVLVGWRYGGPVQANQGRDSRAIDEMNRALEAVRMSHRADFAADYGAVLGSALAGKNHRRPFPVHPPAAPRTAYLNLLLNALALAAQDGT
jgi:hypothetical protein